MTETRRWHRLVLAFLVAWGTTTFADDYVEIREDLHAEKIAEGVWRHISFNETEDWGRIPANGLVVMSGTEAALIDTPWTNEQTRALVDWLTRGFGVRVRFAIASHSHADCLGGLDAIHELGATSWGSTGTVAFAREGNRTPPQNSFEKARDLQLGMLTLELRTLGAGHTLDNSIVWIPDLKLLWGGCLVKSAKSNTMGYIDEADLEAWPRTIERIRASYSDVELVVPGHGRPGGTELYDRTIELIRDLEGAGRE